MRCTVRLGFYKAVGHIRVCHQMQRAIPVGVNDERISLCAEKQHHHLLAARIV